MAVRVPISPALSYASLELAHILDNASLPPLLSESCPLSSTSTSESTLATIPSFPSGHGPLSTFPLVAFNETGLLHSELVIISVPTPSRLKGVLEEHLSVRKWATTLDPSMAPGHVPWSDLEDTAEPSIWMPEGSIQSPRAFGLASSNTRIPSLLGSSLHNTTLHRKSFRNAQVFEQEITLNTGGTTQRWSMDIPPNAVLPGTVDLVLNLTSSSSSKHVEQLVTSASFSHILADQPSLPQDALEDLVNDGASDNFDRLPSDPSVNLDSFPQVPTLATRRGHQELPRLTLQSHPLLTSPYPDLPTAFIGTPSYTPNDTVEIASVQTDSLPLHAMITNLRERCRSLVPRTPVDTVEHSLSRPIPVDQQNPSAEHD
ncbi:hypothetical protein DL96DRAFT_1811326 [Flagelloscypha sp. PMI_526]|nr:hypothetical protein DL96DRAFT_1811326 [Flagelloscypha sp. PMI_526]